MQRLGAAMYILLWYLPFTMFSGACDLAFSMDQTRKAGQPADPAERTRESDDPTYDRLGAG
jgi:hypothetical protein